MPRSSKPDPEDPIACERVAVGLLARREHSRLELERKLRARAFDAGVVTAALDRLEGQGLLDARRFISSFIESRAARGFGPVRIRAELGERGAAPEEAAAVLAATERDWAALAARVRRKRFGAAPPKTFEERARQARFLQYRGFDPGDVEAALDLDNESE